MKRDVIFAILVCSTAALLFAREPKKYISTGDKTNCFGVNFNSFVYLTNYDLAESEILEIYPMNKDTCRFVITRAVNKNGQYYPFTFYLKTGDIIMFNLTGFYSGNPMYYKVLGFTNNTLNIEYQQQLTEAATKTSAVPDTTVTEDNTTPVTPAEEAK